jgi:hypothetical protein
MAITQALVAFISRRSLGQILSALLDRAVLASRSPNSQQVAE